MSGVVRGLTLAFVAVVLAAGCPAEPPGDGPATANAPGAPWFEEVAGQRGLNFTHESGHREVPYMPEIMGGGAALFDMDGDGDLDAYLVQSGSLHADGEHPPNRLFRNDDGRFTDVTESSGAGDRGYGMGVATGDYDGDGDLDLYVTNVGRNTLLRNEGAGRFVDVTDRAGVGDESWGTSTAFLDYDGDADLDLFVVNYVHWSMDTERECLDALGRRNYCSPRTYDTPAMDVLYRNEGDGTFRDVTVEAGLDAGFGNGLGITTADFDGDGRTDVFVANDGTLDQLWHNGGDGTFEDVALIRGCAADQEGLAKAGMGVAVGDVDDDGDLDLLVCNLNHESDSFFRNDGEYFSDVTAQGGLGAVSRPFTRFGLGWVDFDNDGLFDLFQANGRVAYVSRAYSDDPYAEPNLLLRGQALGGFEEVEPRGGTEPMLIETSRAAAFGDLDGDGGVDVLVVNRDAPAHLLRNVVPGRARWIGFDLVDPEAPTHGAQVRVRIEGREVRRDVRPDYSYLASNSRTVHFGLGLADRATDVRVTWPDGTEESFGDFEPDQRVTLTRSRR